MRTRSTLPTATTAFSALLLAALVGACASAGADPTRSPSQPDRSQGADASDGEPVGDDAEMPIGGISDDTIADLIAAAAADANVDVDEIRVVTAEEVTWPNGALGCPEPGMGYTEALVPGFRVVLEIDGEELHFHASEGGEFRFCDDPEPPLDR